MVKFAVLGTIKSNGSRMTVRCVLITTQERVVSTGAGFIVSLGGSGQVKSKGGTYNLWRTSRDWI